MRSAVVDTQHKKTAILWCVFAHYFHDVQFRRGKNALRVRHFIYFLQVLDYSNQVYPLCVLFVFRTKLQRLPS